jgi:hypothetical protein
MRDVLNRDEVFNLERDKRMTAEINSPSSATQDLLIIARDL